MKKLIITLAVICGFGYFVYANLQGVSDECSSLRSSLEESLSSANYCSTDSDCIAVYFTCPLPCSSLINRAENGKIKELEKSFLSRCMPLCEHSCETISASSISCQEQRCVVQ